MSEKIAVVGLGYVGLPVALAFARKNEGVIGFDIDHTRVRELREGHDRTHEVEDGDLASSTISFTADEADLRDATVYVVAVPTPIDESRRPDLRALKGASELVSRVLGKGDLVVYESTVFPGATRDVCLPILAEGSGLAEADFELGYSPERINPGDKVHRLETIVKVVSGSTPAALERVASLYDTIVDAGVHRAATLETAEAAKVIENTQRDLNIALMNELALIFDKLDIRTADVLAAAGTKWNFLPFTPGLVGGHCIGVDPYYLTAKAESLGYDPQVILAGRRINDSMGERIAQRCVKLLVGSGLFEKGAKVAVMGLTFKENVPDLRNSRVPDIIDELRSFGLEVLVHDPLADADEAKHEYGVELVQREAIEGVDAMILAVPHEAYRSDLGGLQSSVRDGGVLLDVKSMMSPQDADSRLTYWSL
ncbi:MAG: UDP-N-acetyl-D-galactosamine dehydrogenase [Sandaracinus sp.]|nr:UDP-N-acetyl-D-galactosamine dehydrogenase [Sandaracinus sp.]|tara:strand:+ start:3387 stop:4661 length:1275 start_codon:yes stop_codon:yes gene_type:complete